MPKGKQVLAQLCKEEKHKNLSRAAIVEEKAGASVAFVVVKPGASNQGAKMIFRHCHKSGHDMESCFQLVGYPDWGPKSDAPSFATAGRGRLIGTGNQGRGRGQHLQERGGGVV